MEFRSIALYVVISSAFFGVALVLAPSQTGAFYGMPMGDAWHVLLGRYFGATLLMYGAAVWGLRGLSDPVAEKNAASGLALATSVGLVVTLLAVTSGTMNALAWSTVALYAFFALAWARLAWLGGAAQGQSSRA